MTETGNRPQILRERMLYGGLTALLAVLGAVIPFVMFAAPIPLGVLTYRQGLQVGMVAALVAGLFTGVFIHAVGLMIVVLVLALGLTLGGGLREGLAPAPLWILGTVVNLVTFLALHLSARAILGLDLLEEMFTGWEETVLQLGRAQIESMSPEEAEAWRQEVEATVRRLRLTIPAMLTMSAGMITLLNMAGIRKALAREGVKTPWFGTFRQWRFPVTLAMVYVAAWVLARAVAEGSALLWLAANLEAALYYVFIVQGLAVIAFYLYRIGVHWGFLIALGVLGLFMPAAHVVLLIIGLVDSGLNLRRL